MFGVESTVWTVAAKKATKRYRGVLEVAKRFKVKWRKDEADLSREHHASVVGSAQNNGRGGTHYHAWLYSYDHTTLGGGGSNN